MTDAIVERRLGIVGAGYVGLVTGVCFAEKGFSVICCDVDEEKIARLNRCEAPIFEPGLEELLRRHAATGKIRFTTFLEETTRSAETLFLAVGTPMSSSGEADLRYVKEAVAAIGRYLDSPKLIVVKSTVPVGTCRQIQSWFDEEAGAKDRKAVVVSNPEFLREGTAIADCLFTERVIIGAENEEAGRRIASLYETFATRTIRTGWESAEMIKYAANAFLAMKISFINEVANLCELTGADVRSVADGIGADSRIGRAFLNAGIGYGGSCFPKDTEALLFLSNRLGYDFRLLKGTIEANRLQRQSVVRKLEQAIGSVQGRTVAVLGLTFKPGTDDMREAPSIAVVQALVARGARVQAFDPLVTEHTRQLLGPGVEYAEHPLAACEAAHAALVLTEWPAVVETDWAAAAERMSGKVIVDGRNCLSPEALAAAGFRYYGIGQQPSIPEPILA